MKTFIASVLLVASASAQEAPDITFGGTHPPDPGVLELVGAYSAGNERISDGVMARSDALQPLQSEGYFYHGWDGAPIGKRALNERQVKNNLKIETSEFFDAHLYQYENTAIATYKTRQTGEDRGERFELLGSGLIVMGREDGEWKVLSDVVGQEPSE